MKHLGLLVLIVGSGAVLAGASFMDKETSCKPQTLAPLKDCHPYPKGGPGAMSCTWTQGPAINPWAPHQRCD